MEHAIGGVHKFHSPQPQSLASERTNAKSLPEIAEQGASVRATAQCDTFTPLSSYGGKTVHCIVSRRGQLRKS